MEMNRYGRYIGNISIHAPQAGCDPSAAQFNIQTVISIHAPQAGCDCERLPPAMEMDYFNPRTPGGVRSERDGQNGMFHVFQSTHPRRGAIANVPKKACSNCNKLQLFSLRTRHIIRIWLYYYIFIILNAKIGFFFGAKPPRNRVCFVFAWSNNQRAFYVK